MAKPYPGLVEDDLLIRGAEIQLGPWMFFVPPMRLIDMRKTLDEGLLTKFDAITNGKVDGATFGEGLTAAATILHRALRRNYPEITVDAIEELIDTENCSQIISVIMEANGLKDRPTWRLTAPQPQPSANGASLTSNSGPTSSVPAPALSAGQET